MPDPQFPIYIVSKGRYDSRLTSKALDRLRVPYSIIVEEQEADHYRAAVEPAGFGTVLVLDPAYQRDYDICGDPLGNSTSKGSGAARNFAWDHALSLGAEWHWCMDDNIRWFYRFTNNTKSHAGDGTVIRCMEDFTLRYTNIAIAGPNYEKFMPRRTNRAAFALNTRIYSCNFIRNALPFRWRGRYNEDTDLSLRVLKAGWCTVQFNAFLQEKQTSMTMRGGNTDELYERNEAFDGRLEMARALQRRHPDVVRVVYKFSRWHHQVDYRPFRTNRLVRRADLPEIDANAVDDYGMVLRASRED